MTIQAIYDHYKIMPQLQLHQLRVAGVAQTIGQALTVQVNLPDMVQACLLHDMGNIIKFDLALYPKFLEPEGLSYWQSVQIYFKQRYGENEFQATLKIAEEIGVTPRVKEIIGAISFTHAAQNFQSNDMEMKICDYADTRVSPNAVVSLEERFEDLEQRYGARYPTEEQQEARKQFRQVMTEIEQQIFALTGELTPENVTELSVQLLIGPLRQTEIQTTGAPSTSTPPTVSSTPLV